MKNIKIYALFLLIWFWSNALLAAPAIVRQLPANDSGAVALNSRFALLFDQTVQAHAGKHIRLHKMLDDSTVQILDVTAQQVTNNGNALIALDLLNGALLQANTGYYLTLDAGAFSDHAGISDKTAWRFTTGTAQDTQPPQPIELTPKNNARQVALDLAGGLLLQFAEPVLPWINKSLIIKRLRDNQTLETLALTSAQVSGTTTTQLKIVPQILLEADQSYYIQIDTGAWRDNAGNEFAGIADKTTWVFGALTTDLSVLGNNKTIAQHDTTPSGDDFTDFGDVVQALADETPQSKQFVFELYNQGGMPLTIGSPAVTLSGEQAADFSLTTLPLNPVPVGAKHSMAIRFIPRALGVRQATVSIASNDATENPYTFVIQGRGVAKDTTPPQLYENFPPTLRDIALHQLTLEVAAVEKALVYFIVLPAGMAKPSAYQIKRGLDAANNLLAPHLRGHFSVDVNAPVKQVVNDLISGSRYQVWLVLEDASGNLTADADVWVLSAETLGAATTGQPEKPIAVPPPAVPVPTGGMTGVYGDDITQNLTNVWLQGDVTVSGFNRVLTHVTFAAGATLSAGNNQIKGWLVGQTATRTPNALIENAVILNGSVLSDVTLGNNIRYPFDVTQLKLNAGVRFTSMEAVPEQVPLLAALGTKVDAPNPSGYPWADLTAHLILGGVSVVEQFNQTPVYQAVGLQFFQDFQLGAGVLVLRNGQQRFALRPVSLQRNSRLPLLTHQSCDFPVMIREGRWFELHSGEHLILTGHAALQAPLALHRILQQYDKTGFVERGDGSLRIDTDEKAAWFIRPALQAQQTDRPAGIYGAQQGLMPLFYLVFEDEQSVLWQQTLYAAPANVNQLHQWADKVFYEDQGRLDVLLQGQRYRGFLAKEASAVANPPATLQMWHIEDKNQDGVSDYLLIYPEGWQQVLYADDFNENNVESTLLDNDTFITANTVLHNVNVSAQAQITGGIYTGNVENHGSLRDIQFNGTRLQCGLLAGKVHAQSGVISNVQLAADSQISGGQLSGLIHGATGARIDNVTLLPYTELHQLRIGKNVAFPAQLHTITLYDGVFDDWADVPKQLELLNILPKKLFNNRKAVDLNARLALNQLDVLTQLQQLWPVEQNADEGWLQWDVQQQRYALLPVSLKRSDEAQGIEIQGDNSVLLTTATGLQVLAVPALQNPIALQVSVRQLGFSQALRWQAENLLLPLGRGFWATLQPNLTSEQLTEATAGLHISEQQLPEFSLAWSQEDALWRQTLSPALWDKNMLAAQTTGLQIDNKGNIRFSLAGITHSGRLDVLLEQRHSDSAQLQVKNVEDFNQDGVKDKLLIYPSSYQQLLFQ